MLRESFKEWLLKKEEHKESTTRNYLNAMEDILEKVDSIKDKYSTIYEIEEISVIDEILMNNQFIEINNKYHRIYSSALKHYREYLELKNIEDTILIKINKSYRPGMSSDELYQVTSASWIISLEKMKYKDIKYYCAIYNNKIMEVYNLVGYHKDPRPGREKRFVLDGEIASEDIREKLIGLYVQKIHNGKGNPIKYTSINTLLELKNQFNGEEIAEVETMKVDVEYKQLDSKNLLLHIYKFISSRGFSYAVKNIANLYLSLRTKPFVIISGISGTGKTKIVQLFAESIGATEENGQFKLIPVRPDWSDSSELLGYTDIKGEFNRGPLTEMVEQALQNPKLPYFVLLDEMNLARVEYYFSDILSVMESRKKEEGQITSSTLITIEGRSLTLPGNLYIIGTVNMDETTHPFSKKVLDRANTIEFNEIDLMNFRSMYNQDPVEPIRVSNDVLESSYIHLIDAFPNNEVLIKEVSKELEAINDILKPIHAQVGYRVRDEICFYMIHNDEAGLLLSREDAMDFCIMQKILPRIGGTEGVVRPVLEKLKEVLPENKYPRCSEKIAEMIRRADSDGFTSFWVS